MEQVSKEVRRERELGKFTDPEDSWPGVMYP
jgi:hypothetical protein